MNAPPRWSDRDQPGWPDEVLVHCPACAACAAVTRVTYRDAGESHRRPCWRVTCTACSFSADSAGRWWGTVTSRAAGRCNRCGAALSRTVHGPQPRHRMVLRCKGCDRLTSLAARSQLASGPGLYAGLPLFLTSDVSGNALWAYNLVHLAEIEAYVTAVIRERQPNRNASFASRLPAWVKSAKNRAAVQKACKRMRARLGS